MDWFLYDIGLRLERVKNDYMNQELRMIASHKSRLKNDYMN